MTIVKGNTSKGKALLQRAKEFKGFDLREVYGRFSEAKYRAWQYCLKQCAEESGRCFHICSANTFGFTVAWESDQGIRIETKDNSYLVLL